MVVTAVLTALAAVIVSMRLFARLKLMKATGLEDWAILISLVFSIIYLALVAARMTSSPPPPHWHSSIIADITLEFHFRMGVHSDQLSPEILQEQLKVRHEVFLDSNGVFEMTDLTITLTVFVGCNSHVQRQSGIHQILHPFSISPHLPRSLFSHRLLYCDGRCGNILILGHC